MRMTGLFAGLLMLVTAGPSFGQRWKASDIIAQFKPSFQGVEYDTPTEAAELEACKLEVLKNDSGWEVKDSQGKLLRRFFDADGKVSKRDKEPKATTHIDQWCYFKDGFEVYRESDIDDDGVVDEVRWLNQGGMRIGTVRGNRIVAWKRLSPEEATKVLVTALVSADAPLLETVIATPAELKSLGMPDSAIEEATAAAAARTRSSAEALKLPKGWDNQTIWSRFDGWMPHTIPNEAATGLAQELILYENGVIFATPSRPHADQGMLGYLHVPELIRIGEVWKFFRLPRSVDPKEPVVANLDQGSLRTLLYGPTRATSNPDEDVLVALSKRLADHEKSMPEPDNERGLAQWHVDRIPIINLEGIKKVRGEENKVGLYKQVIHDLAEAYRSGFYPQGKETFKSLVGMGGKVGAFAAYRLILAEFDLEASKPNVKLEALHEQSLKDLETWLGTYPTADEVPEVLWQLASAHDLDNEEDQARKFCNRLIKDYGDTEWGKKAVGALRRLDAVGKPLLISGPSLAGQPVRTSDFAGKNLVVIFWMSVAEPDRRELADLVDILKKVKDKNVDVLTINLDIDKPVVEDYLRANSLSWPVIFEPGGLDSRLGTEFGIVATPTIFLLDPQGKVVSARIRKASEIQRFLDKPLAAGNADIDVSR